MFSKAPTATSRTGALIRAARHLIAKSAAAAHPDRGISIAPLARAGANAPAHQASPSTRGPSTACAATSRAAFASSPASMSCHEVQALVASGAYAYVDVRSPEEYAAAHPEGAVNVPVWLKDSSGGFVPNPAFLSDFKSRFDSSAQLCVGCASGKRSQAAIAMLQPEGYSDLINVEGGFSAWAGAGLPVAK